MILACVGVLAVLGVAALVGGVLRGSDPVDPVDPVDPSGVPAARIAEDEPAPGSLPLASLSTPGWPGDVVGDALSALKDATAPRAPAHPAPAAPVRPSGPLAQVVDLINQKRAAAGCGPLTVDPRISRAAQKHSDDMRSRGYFEHDAPDGDSFSDRLSAEGYPEPGGENIAKGQDDAPQVVREWMESPGHRDNIEDCSFRTTGVGLSGGYWTQDFGR